MESIQRIDTVLQHLWEAIERLQLPLDATITQQILLLGDAFYGYRFTSSDFTAVWSAEDQILKVFDAHGRALEVFQVSAITGETSVELVPLSTQRKAA